MPDYKGDPDVRPIQAIRVDQVRTCRYGLYRHRRLSRRRRLDAPLLRRCGTKRTSFQLRADRNHRSNERSVWQIAGACEGAGQRECRSRFGGHRRDAKGYAASGCPMAAPVLPRSPHRADAGQGRYGDRLQSSRLQAAEARWVILIVDHAATAGSGTSDAQSLHRIDPASVRKEVEAAGFVLDAESTMLAKKDDPHSIKVFDPSIKGETDRFAYRFVKP